ncbi:polysaccharide deacetylase family protein [Verticiella sediminum]|uniref:Polysaccharide deacetylase family protein n=2 Tax=Verticiella sediminum TaxID=1247510 RepID=A0A556AL70_9BURK|nr:polysaccharide deacetylase family protein [Verticiella sediminum]
MTAPACQAPWPGRDFVGYAGRPPHAGWPGGARIALNFALNIEEGAEYSPLDGDAHTDTALTEGVGMDTGIAGRDLSAESMYEYGSRVGVWRLLELFSRRALPLTLFVCALALERNPALAAALRGTLHDVCCHGWRWEKPWLLSAETEMAHIARAQASLRRTLGREAEGWCCRYGPSEHTRGLLAKAGLLYDSDSCNDELPYWCRVEGAPHLVVPYSLVTNDCKLAPGGLPTPNDFFALLRDSFDQLYEEGERSPRMMTVGLHPRMVGHPGRARGLARFLDHVARHERVWVCRRADIAHHWRTRFPAPQETAA